MFDVLVEAARYKATRGSFLYSPKQRSFIKADAIIWASLSRPGDDGFPLAVMVGQRNTVPRLFVHIPVRDAFAAEVADAAYLADIGRFLGSAFDSGVDGDWPQLIVGSSSDIEHVQGVAIRAAGVGDVVRDEVPSQDVFDARIFGLRLGHIACSRHHAFGQQACLSLTDIFARHVATGLSDVERENIFCHSYAAYIDTSSAGPSKARQLLSTQASHRPTPSTDAFLGSVIKDRDLARLSEFSSKHLGSIWQIIADGLNFIERSYAESCDHLVELSEEEAMRSSYFRKNISSESFQFKDFRYRFRGGSVNDLQTTIEYAEAELGRRKFESLEVFCDPVVRASMRLRDCRDFSWGTVIQVVSRRFQIELAATSSNPDPRKVFSWIGSKFSNDIPVFIEYKEDVVTGQRLVTVGLRGEGVMPVIGDIVQLYEKDNFNGVATTKRLAKLRIPQPSVLRSTHESPIPPPTVIVRGLADDLRNNRL